MRAANRAENVQQREAKESRRREKQRKAWAQEQGEDVEDDDDDDDVEEEEGETMVDTEWVDLTNEDELIGAGSSSQALPRPLGGASGPLPSHGVESTSWGLTESGDNVSAPRSRRRQGAPLTRRRS